MGDEAGGQLTGQPAHAGVDPAEPGGRRDDVRVGTGVEIRLHTGQPVDLAVVGELTAGAERLVERGQRLDVLANAHDRRSTRHAHTALDVIPYMDTKAEMAASL